MSARSLIGLLLLVLGLGAWLLLGGEEREDPTPGLDLSTLLPREELRGISIESPGEDPVEILRARGAWTVNGYPARDSVLDAVLASLRDGAPLRLIARSESTHGRMGLSAPEAIRVTFAAAGSEGAVTLLVGVEGRDGRFVRVDGTEPAYVAPAGVLDPLIESGGELRDFTILRADTAGIRRVVIRRRGRGATEVLRTNSGWRVDGRPADEEKIRVYLETLADLQASGFPADSFVSAADFDRPDATVEMYLESPAGLGPDRSLLFAAARDHPHVLVRRGDSPIVYTLDRLRATFLTSTARTLAEAP